MSGQALYYHRVGTSQSDDRLIYARPDLPTWFINGSVTEDGRYLLVFMYKGSDNNNRLYYADLGDPKTPKVGAPVKPLIEADDAEFAAFGNADRRLYLRTDRGRAEQKSDRDRRATIRSPPPGRTIVPEGSEAIETVSLIGGRLVAQYLVDVQSRLSLVGLDGRPQGDLALPGTGTVAGSVDARTRRRSSTPSARRSLPPAVFLRSCFEGADAV